MLPEAEGQPIRFLKRQGLLDPLAVGHLPLGRSRGEDEGLCGREDRGPDPYRAEEMPTTEYFVIYAHVAICLLVCLPMGQGSDPKVRVVSRLATAHQGQCQPVLPTVKGSTKK